MFTFRSDRFAGAISVQSGPPETPPPSALSVTSRSDGADDMSETSSNSIPMDASAYPALLVPVVNAWALFAPAEPRSWPASPGCVVLPTSAAAVSASSTEGRTTPPTPL